jgi:hypothetical protein
MRTSSRPPFSSRNRFRSSGMLRCANSRCTGTFHPGETGNGVRQSGVRADLFGHSGARALARGADRVAPYRAIVAHGLFWHHARQLPRRGQELGPAAADMRAAEDVAEVPSLSRRTVTQLARAQRGGLACHHHAAQSSRVTTELSRHLCHAARVWHRHQAVHRLHPVRGAPRPNMRGGRHCGTDERGQVNEHAVLTWLLSTVTPYSWLQRMTQFKVRGNCHTEASHRCRGRRRHRRAPIGAFRRTKPRRWRRDTHRSRCIRTPC